MVCEDCFDHVDMISSLPLCLAYHFHSVTVFMNISQVVDLHEVPPESALEFCKLLPNHRTRVLICGGDGSVGWVLGALDKVKIKVCKLSLFFPFRKRLTGKTSGNP